MVAIAPTPLDETARVEALRGYLILDTEPDARFDLFTKMSTWLYDAPTAAINLVDSERTFFKSIIGFARYEPLRATSICAHTIASGDDIMVVPDLGLDRRFDDHPMTIRGLRFYAGAVLRSSSDHAIGTLCIGDVKTRGFSEPEKDRLKHLAQGVGAVLELHRNSLMLLNAANHDALTGLSNRRLLMERLACVLPESTSDQPVALLYLDLDRFKAVNDHFGHPGGDLLLCEVARRLLQTAGAGDLAVRIAGDEFAVLLNASLHSAEAMAKRILAAFAAPFTIDGINVPIGGSIGIATSPLHATDAEGLIRCADLALYDAKKAGRNCSATFGSPAALTAVGLGIERPWR